ncbi:MAG: hypothetical protein KAR85_07115 [Methanosarcinales archaeon]|nr:hypothetical protein [Methanosarcinales archaeon]
MKILKEEAGRFPFGMWIAIAAILAIFLWTIPSLLGIIGLWENREYFNE